MLPRRWLAAARVVVALGLASCSHPAQPPPAQRSLRVLFIGNSYTYFNNLPEVFTQLARAGRQAAVETRMVAPGGSTLRDHWQKQDALRALHDGRWDHVVLQEQSTLGVEYLLDGKVRVTSDEVFRPWAERWAAEIARTGATAIFYLTWARRDTPDDQAALNHAYMEAARASRAAVAPVGLAWAEVRKRQPALQLFAEDGSHPAPAGTYLSACAFYAAIFDRSPEGLPATITGTPVDLETEQPQPGKTAVLVDLSTEEARLLQSAAWNATRELDRSGATIGAAPPAPTPAPLPAGALLSAVDLEGGWHGELRFYPAGPTEMVLHLRRRGEAWSGQLELRHRSGAPGSRSFDLADVRVGDRELTFTDPKGLGGLLIHFRGVSTQPPQLCGTAEAALPTQSGPTQRILGSWCLEREHDR